MRVLETGCLGIAITYNPESKDGAFIQSDMHEPNTPDNKGFNSAIDALESLILAHFCEDVDITDLNYLVGIETAYEAVVNNVE